ncbi:DUF6895 family protein [Kitasatospora sp. NPDC058965]|uniref:DUF6895 family protein n=1 Tax=Kitasatospora sp. NPDC058965 TaxID=3346682 RepID=UPI0036CEC9D8
MTGTTRRWDCADLERRLLRTLDIALRAVDVLAPDGYRDAVDPTVDVRPEKVVTETAMLVLAAARAAVDRPALRARVDELARRLAPHARGERARAAVCLEPAMALSHGCAHVCLSRAGHPDPAFDRLLHTACTWPRTAPGRERPPHRDLEQVWLTELSGIPQQARRTYTLHPVLARSMLGRPLDALAGSRDDAYALTHAVMFATDLGSRRPRLPRPLSAVQADTEAAMATSLDQHDYDLAGELLFCGPMLGQPWSPASVFAFQLLTTADDQAGFLPTPLVRSERYHGLGSEDRSRYALATTYHAVYVLGLLCAVTLTNRVAPPVDIAPDTSGCLGAVEQLLAQLPARTGDQDEQPQWYQRLLALPPRQQARLSPLVLSIALRRAVDLRRLDCVQLLLESARQWDLLQAPGAGQAGHLLLRASLLASWESDDECAPPPAALRADSLTGSA